MAKKRRPNADAARMTVLAAAGGDAWRAHVLEVLVSGDRLAREAALEALVEQPLPEARDALRALYVELNGDGTKLDQGATMRTMIVRILAAIADPRDADIALRAADTFETLYGEDVCWRLRTHGLRMLAHTAPDVFAYVAAEHFDDHDDVSGRTEPANTVLQLLAAMGRQPQIYQWLISRDLPPQQTAAAFELLAEAPPLVVERYAKRVVAVALRAEDDALAMAVAEAIVEREIEALYPALADVLAAKISDELYGYLAMLLAGTNRPALLTILEHQLHRGRRPALVEAALRVRTTPEQAQILRRWEDGGD